MTHQQMEIKIKELEKRINALEQEPMEEIDFIQPKKVVGKLISTDILDKIREIVDEWESDTWSEDLSYGCMIKIAKLVKSQEVRNEE